MNNLTNSGQKLINLPSNLVTGVINNFKTTFNIDNFVNYLTTDNYNEIKDYSKSVVQTGVTLYGGYNVGKGIYNKIQTNKVMNSVNISNINYDKLGQIGNEYSISKINPYDGAIINFGNTIKLPPNDSQLKHIFRNDRGYLSDTIENRKLLEQIANDKNNYLGQDMNSISWYGKVNPNGTQTWVSVYNGIIQNGGINDVPHKFNSKTGLSTFLKRGK